MFFMGRKKTKGKFDSREELVDFVWSEWRNTDRNQAQIAKAAGVSTGTVSLILDMPPPEILK